LHIDERGLNELVNKFIREQVAKAESKLSPEAIIPEEIPGQDERSDWSNEAYSILHQDKLQEEAIVRVLLEHGLKPWDAEKTVADYIFESEIFDDIFEDKILLRLADAYKEKYTNNERPAIVDFAYLEDPEVSKVAISITNFPYELSDNWKGELHSDGVNKIVWNLPYETFMKEVIRHGDVNPEIYNKDTGDHYKAHVEDVLDYIKLRKIRKMILLNQADMQQEHSENEMLTLIHTHNYLKQEQMKIGAKKKGIVNYPF
jgi:DNA primase